MDCRYGGTAIQTAAAQRPPVDETTTSNGSQRSRHFERWQRGARIGGREARFVKRLFPRRLIRTLNRSATQMPLKLKEDNMVICGPHLCAFCRLPIESEQRWVREKIYEPTQNGRDPSYEKAFNGTVQVSRPVALIRASAIRNCRASSLMRERKGLYVARPTRACTFRSSI